MGKGGNKTPVTLTLIEIQRIPILGKVVIIGGQKGDNSHFGTNGGIPIVEVIGY